MGGDIDGNPGHGIDFTIVVLSLLAQGIGLDQERQGDGMAPLAVHLTFSQGGEVPDRCHAQPPILLMDIRQIQ
jgi:hypothetical protein